MRAIALADFETALAVRQVPDPDPAAGELLVRVRAASVNRVDVLIAGGALRGFMEYEFPVVPGRDFAGVVERVGPGVSRFREGDDVLGWITSPVLHHGTWAELAVVPESGSVARTPAVLDDVRAACLPLAALCAHAAVEAVAPGPGDRVLVVGASGGVGGFAVQLVASAGASVVATASPGDEERLLGLGAQSVVGHDLAGADGVDGLIDLVSAQPDGFERTAALVREGGRAASTLGVANDAGRGLAATNVMADANDPAGLERLAALAAAGELRIDVDGIFALEDAPAAVDAFARGKRGKIALTASPVK